MTVGWGHCSAERPWAERKWRGRDNRPMDAVTLSSHLKNGAKKNTGNLMGYTGHQTAQKRRELGMKGFSFPDSGYMSLLF